MTTDHSICLRDGRTLAYTEHGDPDGQPVFFFHGNPGSRLTRHPDESIATSLGARIITPDRPGYGRSNYQPGRTLLDWPDDVAQLADALGVDRFAVVGWSAGGPEALACLAQLPERATRAALIAGAAPLDRPDAYDGVHPTYQAGYRLAERSGCLVRPLLWLQTRLALRDRARSYAATARTFSADDQAMLERPDIKEQVMGYLPEAARQGARGLAQELKILVSPWGFDLATIQQPVALWYWDGDTLVPPAMARYLAGALPNAELKLLPGGGHFAWFDHWAAILGDVLNLE